MHRFNYEPHAADLRMRISAPALPDLFHAALEGMSEMIEPGSCGRPGSEGGDSDFPLQASLDLRAPDTTVLLIDFLSQVLTLSHVRRALFCRLDITRFGAPETGTPDTGAGDDAFLMGAVRGRDTHSWQHDLKAVSFHEAEIRRGPDGWWETLVVFDV